nr:F-box protein At5g49610-like [Ipomoea trifida]
MLVLPTRPSKEWRNIVGSTKGGYSITGSAANEQIGPVLGLVDIGESEDSYLFRVSLPGVKRDESEAGKAEVGTGFDRRSGIATSVRRRLLAVSIFSPSKALAPITAMIGLDDKRNLPADMLIEILSRLPSKALAPMRLVSKNWKCIISDRNFIRHQLKRRENLSGFFFQDYCHDFRDADFKSVCYVSVDSDFTKVEKGVLNFLPEKVVILSSSNGLICCRSSFPCLEPVLYVCNPLNRECITLQWPNIPKVSSPEQITDSRTVLIFEPVKSCKIDVSTDFQVVTVCQTKFYEGGFPIWLFSFHIYSSESKEWIKSTEMCCYNRSLQEAGCAIVEENIFWLTVGQNILMFKPKNEKCLFIKKPFPAPDFFDTVGTCLGESEGNLLFLRISKEDGVRVWELKDSISSEWIQKHCISLEDIEKENVCMESYLTTTPFPWINPLSFKDMTLFLRVSSYIYAFNFDTRKAKLLCPYSEYGPNDIFEHTVVPYTMSLAPLT